MVVTIQNIMRRIIETYFKIFGNYKDDTLIEKFTTEEERMICKSLLSWINDGSHSILDDLYIEPSGNIESYSEVFEKIFTHTNNKGHYDMMMKIEN